MKEEEIKNKPGKPWNVAATFDTYQEADQYRNEKISLWEKKETKGMQAKVHRRRSNNKFVVKTRLHPDFEPKLKKEKKRGKRKNRNSSKRNSSEGKVQVNKTGV